MRDNTPPQSYGDKEKSKVRTKHELTQAADATEGVWRFSFASLLAAHNAAGLAGEMSGLRELADLTSVVTFDISLR
jgi:hypothetical protein